MDAEVAAALWQVEAAFVAHQAREVLESLTPRQGPVVVAEIDFLDDASGLGDGPARFIGIWEYKDTASADHHLAELVVDAHYGARVDPEVLVWARDRPQRERLARAAVRDRHEWWSGDLGAALDVLDVTPPN